MSNGELRDLLRAGEEGLARAEAGARVDEFRIARVTSAARRRRGARAALMAAAAVVGVAVVGASALFLANRGDVPPIATPSGSSSHTSSATPSPSPSQPQAMPAFSGKVTEHEWLPGATAITAQAWEAATAGWVLAMYRVEGDTDGEDGTSSEREGFQVIYLVSPAGERYELTTIADPGDVSIAQWSPGDPSALVEYYADGDELLQEWKTLDLATGELVDAAQGPPDPVVTGRQMDAIAAAEAAYDGPIDNVCRANAAWDAESDLVTCASFYDPAPVSDARFYRVYLDGRVEDVTPEPDGQLYASPYAGPDVAGGRLVVGVGKIDDEGCPADRAVVIDDAMVGLPGVAALQNMATSQGEPAPHSFGVGSVGSSTYTMVLGSDCGEGAVAGLVRDDVDTGEFAVLLPFTATSSDTGWVGNLLTSVYVVPEPQ